MKKMKVGETIRYQGYPITKEDEDEFRVSIYADDLDTAKDVIKKCLEHGIIEWPIQVVGRLKRAK